MDVLSLTIDTATGDVTATSGEVVDITSDAFTADAEVQALVDRRGRGRGGRSPADRDDHPGHHAWLAGGGDNFGTLADGTDRLDGGFNDLNLLVEYVQENSPITPSLDDRSVPAGTEPALLLERLAGADRFGTAAEVVLETFGAAPEALLGNGSTPADALAGSYLAGVRSAPVLLTARDTLPARTLDALRRLGTETVTILGGTDVV
ncbi:MAG: cell wall-binding repeat-containing protein, partial [Frankiaceae bacterium]|nr:cell wall-binding repeat-containing protein [Frankiaceae bacterium]